MYEKSPSLSRAWTAVLIDGEGVGFNEVLLIVFSSGGCAMGYLDACFAAFLLDGLDAAFA